MDITSCGFQAMENGLQGAEPEQRRPAGKSVNKPSEKELKILRMSHRVPNELLPAFLYFKKFCPLEQGYLWNDPMSSGISLNSS